MASTNYIDEFPSVTIIIPCRNEKKYIHSFIQSLLSQDYPSDRIEVIIADGMSDDGTKEILKEICATHGHIHVVENPKKIVPTGLNIAILAARNNIILRLDMHTEYAPDYVLKCVETLMRTAAGNVGGPARTTANSLLQKVIASAYHSSFAVGGATFHFEDFEGEVDTVPYGCWRKETLIKIGLFDEEFVRNQDDELNFRLQKSGMKIWQNPEIRSWYHPRNSLGKLFKQYYQYGYWKVRVILKHRRPASLRHLVPGAFVFTCFLLIVLTPFVPILRWILLGVLAFYALFLLVGSIVTSGKSSWLYFPILPVVFTVYHMAYGMGFLHGLFVQAVGLSWHSRSTTSLSR